MSSVVDILDKGYYRLDEVVDMKIWCDLDDDIPLKERDIHQAMLLIDHLQEHLGVLARELQNLPQQVQ